MKKYKFKTKPFDHQLIALDKSWVKKSMLCLWKWVPVKLKLL
jgi:hypothetical protein